MNKLIENSDQPENGPKSTYVLLIRSEERNRNLLEIAFYQFLLIIGLITICQFALQTAQPFHTRVRVCVGQPESCVFD